VQQKKYSNRKIDRPHWYSVIPKISSDSSGFYKRVMSREINIQPFDIEYLQKILCLAKERNIQIVLFTSPDFIQQEKIYSNYHIANKTLDSILKPYSLIQFKADDSLRNNISLFKDPAHLNNYGMFLHTKSFAEKYWKYVEKMQSNGHLTN
jgi:hypothetical protein